METTVRPAGAPVCWGRQYDSDQNTQSGRECAGCTFNYSCKNACQSAAARHMTAYQQQQQQQPQWPQATWGWQGWNPAWQAQQPAPPPPPSPPAPPGRSLPVWQGNVPPIPPPPAPPAVWGRPQAPPPPPVAYQQQPPPMYPQQQQEYFMAVLGQYPGEPIGERLGKNIILRALEAIFNELTRFFHFWTWPRKG